MKHYLFLILCIGFCLSGCQSPPSNTLQVAATSSPHAEILEFVKPDLKAKGIDLTIVVMDDFNMQNRALADGEVDANFFQHLPFLEAQKKDFHYRLEPLVSVHIEPMGLYSKKIKSLDQLKERATIAIPSDPSNQTRALLLLEQKGVIQLRQQINPSLLDVTANPKHLEFVEIDSPLLTRTLEDVDAAAISTNFALQGGLSPTKEAIAMEDTHSQFANLIVIREGESQRPDLQALKQSLTTEKVHQWIEIHYPNAVIPAF